MGFSTVAAQVLFFIAVLSISAGVIAVFGNYVDEAKGAMSDRQDYITGQLRTDIVLTTVDNSSGNLHVYVKNVGDEQLATDCMELFVDSGYVSLSAAQKVDPSTENPITEVDPEDTVKFKPSAAALNDGSIHEAKVVTCNGISDTLDFSS